jgi:hypothetical protein
MSVTVHLQLSLAITIPLAVQLLPAQRAFSGGSRRSRHRGAQGCSRKLTLPKTRMVTSGSTGGSINEGADGANKSGLHRPLGFWTGEQA